MKAKDLANLLLQNPDFDIQFTFVDDRSDFLDYRTFNITGISDIGYSSKVIVLGTNDKTND